MSRSQRSPNVVDERQELRDEHAVERLVGDAGRIGDVGDERRPRVVLLDVEDVSLPHSSTELSDVLVAGDLEHAALDVGRVPSHELFDVVAIDWSAAALSPRPEGRGLSQIAKISGLSPRRPTSFGSDLVHPLPNPPPHALAPEATSRRDDVHRGRQPTRWGERYLPVLWFARS